MTTDRMDNAWQWFGMLCIAAVLASATRCGFKECDATTRNKQWCIEHGGVFRDPDCVRPIVPEGSR